MQKYQQSCQTEFWRRIFRAEADYLARELTGCVDVLSVGCGPAIVEGLLTERGFRVTGVDISREALDAAPAAVHTVTASAENLPFPAASFDAVLFVVSLQFIRDYRKAVSEAARVLREGGRFIALLLNPASNFFQARLRRPDSYVRKLQHSDLAEIERVVADWFEIRTEYFLGINDTTLFATQSPQQAALYVINGKRKEKPA